MLENKYFVTKVGFDIAEKEPSIIWQIWQPFAKLPFVQLVSSSAAGRRRTRRRRPGRGWARRRPDRSRSSPGTPGSPRLERRNPVEVQVRNHSQCVSQNQSELSLEHHSPQRKRILLSYDMVIMSTREWIAAFPVDRLRFFYIRVAQI